MILLGIDTGGTFTDFVLVKSTSADHLQLIIHKVLSTPSAPEQAILQGIDELGLASVSHENIYIVHGSTVATNAVLEGKVARTAYITNRGMGDVLTLGRQARRELYNLQPAPVSPPVPTELCLETGGRISSNGEVLEPLSPADLQLLQTQLQQLRPQAVAINLLFSYLDDRFEKQIAASIADDIFISRSSEVLPEIKEYERGITTWLNASVGPVVQRYLSRLSEGVNMRLPQQESYRTHISVMQSAGGTIEAGQAAQQAVHMLLSGPAGGMAGAQFIAACSAKKRLLTFDMGGTSTDVALIDGELQLTSEGHIGNYPVAVPMVDMHTIGAGGGSIATVDEGGLLQVGPQSAGADPGPACYGRGGQFATVTDANLVLGRLRPDAFLGGNMSLEVKAAREVIQPLATRLNISIEAMAEGIIRLANEHMARALRVMSVQRGIDPRNLTLVSFGGAGGLHVCALADALSMREAIVPVNAGVLSALGMLVAPRARHLSQSFSGNIDQVEENLLEQVLEELGRRGATALLAEGLSENEIFVVPSVDVRYLGQSYTLNVEWLGKQKTADSFHFIHEQRYGHRLDQPVELVTARVKVQGSVATVSDFHGLLKKTASVSVNQTKVEYVSLYGFSGSVPVIARDSLGQNVVVTGPALITELVSTTFIQEGWQCVADETGNLLLTVVR